MKIKIIIEISINIIKKFFEILEIKIVLKFGIIIHLITLPEISIKKHNNIIDKFIVKLKLNLITEEFITPFNRIIKIIRIQYRKVNKIPKKKIEIKIILFILNMNNSTIKSFE